MKNRKGITLIALVITVIVLLILAGAAVSVGINGNNMFELANDAKQKWNNDALKEEVSLVLTLHYNELTLGAKLNHLTDAKIEPILGLIDTYCVTKGNSQVTVYPDGEILDGTVSVWDGDGNAECPVFQKEGNIWNWYISTAGQLEFLADFVNDGNGVNVPSSMESIVTSAGYDVSDIVMTPSTTINIVNNIDLGARPTVEEVTIDSSITDDIEREVATEVAKWAENTKKWTPIGTSSGNVQNKLGTVNGNNYCINGMYVDREEKFNGLFGNSNTIQNLTIKNSFVAGSSNTGGIVGALRSGKIENCHNTNTTVILTGTNSYKIGGVIGQASENTLISNCSNTGKIFGTGEGDSEGDVMCGGIIGYSFNNKIEECTNRGTIKCSKSSAGGIAGEVKNNYLMQEENIYKCDNYGSIMVKDSFAGGIVGITFNTTKQCSNYGTAIGKKSVGGIIGSVGSTIEDNRTAQTYECINSGEVIGEQYIGGIIGSTNPYDTLDIKNCTNSGKISGQHDVGGIVGALKNKKKITKCNNIGAISGLSDIGGICGMQSPGSVVINNYNINNGNKLKGDYNIGGITGDSYGGTIKNNYSITDIECTGNTEAIIGGIVGNINSLSEEGETSNNYYIKNSINLEFNNEGEEKDSAYMRSSAILTKLNEGQNPAVWEFRENENDGYPVFVK